MSIETRSSHVKSNSISRQRNAAGIIPAVSTSSNRSLSPSREKKRIKDETSNTKGTIRYGLLLILVLFGIGYLIRGFMRDREVISLAKERKRTQRGENWVLNSKAIDPTDPTPICKRVMLFVFNDSTSFATQIQYLVKSTIIAQKTGYILLSDSTHFNYGGLREFFHPQTIFCKPPADWFIPGKSLASRRWRFSDKVYVDQKASKAVDDWILDEVDEEVEDIYLEFAQALALIWKPVDSIESLILKERIELGLGTGEGVRQRKHSPSRGGNRKKMGIKRKSVEEVHASDSQEEHDFEFIGSFARADRGPVIGVIGEVEDSRLAVTIQSTIDRLTSTRLGSRNQRSFPTTAKINLVLHTAQNPNLLPFVSNIANIQITKSQLVEDGTQRYSNITSDYFHSRPLFDALPLDARIHLTSLYVRSLTTFALFGDGLIASGEDGKLAVLLAGELGGRVVSLEPWSPV